MYSNEVISEFKTKIQQPQLARFSGIPVSYLGGQKSANIERYSRANVTKTTFDQIRALLPPGNIVTCEVPLTSPPTDSYLPVRTGGNNTPARTVRPDFLVPGRDERTFIVAHSEMFGLNSLIPTSVSDTTTKVSDAADNVSVLANETSQKVNKAADEVSEFAAVSRDFIGSITKEQKAGLGLVGSAVSTVGSIQRAFKSLWDNKLLRCTFVGAVSAYVVTKLVKLYRTTVGPALDVMFAKVKQIFRILVSQFSQLKPVQFLIDTFSRTYVVNTAETIANTADSIYVDAKSESDTDQAPKEKSMSKVMALVAGITAALAVGAGKAMFAVKSLVRSFTRVVADISKTIRGLRSITDLVNAIVDRLPDSIRVFMNESLGLGNIKHHVSELHSRACTTVAAHVLRGNYKLTEAEKASTTKLIADILTAFKNARGAERQLMKDALVLLKKIDLDKPPSRPVKKSCLIVMSGDAGLGKTVLANTICRFFAPTQREALFVKPQSAEHDDGWSDQFAILVDDVLAVNKPPAEHAALLQSILELASLSTTLANMARLDGPHGKGCPMDPDYLFVTTNATHDRIESHWTYTEAIRRRLYSEEAVFLEMRAKRSVKKNGQIDHSKIRNLTKEQRANFEHMYVDLLRFDGNSVVKKRINNFTELMMVVLEARRACDESADEVDKQAMDNWLEGGRSFRAIHRMEGHEQFPVVTETISGQEVKIRIYPRERRREFRELLQEEILLEWAAERDRTGRRIGGKVKEKTKRADTPLEAKVEYLAEEDVFAQLRCLDLDELPSEAEEIERKEAAIDEHVRRYIDTGLVGEDWSVECQYVPDEPRGYISRLRDTLTNDRFGVSVVEVLGYVAAGAGFYLLMNNGDFFADKFESGKGWLNRQYQGFLDLDPESKDSEAIVVKLSQANLGVAMTAIAAHSESITRKPTPGPAKKARSMRFTPLAKLAKSESKMSGPPVIQGDNAHRVAKVARQVISVTAASSAHGIFVGPNTYLTCTHLFTTMNPLIHENPRAFIHDETSSKGLEYKWADPEVKTDPIQILPQPVTICSSMTSNHRDRYMTVEVNPLDSMRVMSYDTERNEIGDLALVSVPPRSMPTYASLTNYFLKPEHWSELEGLHAFIIQRDGTRVDVGALRVLERRFWAAAARDTSTSPNRIVSRAFYTSADAVVVYGRHQPGWCGLPVMVVYKKTVYIIGVHVAQYGDGNHGMAVLTDMSVTPSREVKEKVPLTYNDAVSELSPYVEGAMVWPAPSTATLTEHDFGFVGDNAVTWMRVAKGNYPPNKSKLYESPVGSTKAFEGLNQVDKNCKTNLRIDMFERLGKIHVLKPPVYYNWDLLAICAEDWINRLGNNVLHGPMPYAAAISGRNHPDCQHDYMPPLDLNTGCGYNRSGDGHNGKHGCIVAIGDPENPDYYEPDEELLAMMHTIRAQMDAGLYPNQPWLPFIKDEAMKERKAAQGLARIVCQATLALTCVIRCEFADALNQFLMRGPDSDSALGMNPESSDWDSMMRKLSSVAGHDGYADADVQTMDAGHRWNILRVMALVTARKVRPSGDVSDLVNLFMCNFARDEVVGNHLVSLFGALPSGSVLTAFINAMVLASLVRYGFLRWCQDNALPVSLELYHKYCKLFGVGDDVILGIAREIIPFEPADAFRFVMRDERGTPVWSVTDANKNTTIGWLDSNSVSFLSRTNRVGSNPGCPGANNFPCFSQSRVAKMLRWFKEGALSEHDLILEKFNTLLMLLHGSGPARFHHMRSCMVSAMAELGVNGYLRTWMDCAAIWQRPDAARGILEPAYSEGHMPFTEVVAHSESALLAPLIGATEVVSGASNVVRTALHGIDEAVQKADFDNPQVYLQNQQVVLSHPSNMNGASQVGYGSMMALDNAPNNSSGDDSHFGVDNQTDIDSLCRPVWLKTFQVSRSTSAAGVVLASGWLTMAPRICEASLDDIIQPIASGYVAARFNTWKADIELRFNFIIPPVVTTRCAVTVLPMVTDIPATIEEIQRPYVHYFIVDAESSDVSITIPYQADTVRKFVPNGPPNLTNSFGRWALWLCNTVSGPDSVSDTFDVNIFQGAKNVTLSGWGLRNDTLYPILADQTALTTTQSEYELVNAKSECYTFVKAHSEMDEPQKAGVSMAETDPSPTPTEIHAIADPQEKVAIDSNHWNMEQCAARPQYLGTISLNDGMPDGTVLLQLSMPNEAILGTHRIPFSNLLAWRGECVLTLKMQGNPFVAMCLIGYYVPCLDPNTAAVVSESKESQTFLDPVFMKAHLSNSVTVRVPFTHTKPLTTVDSESYGTYFLKVFNAARLGAGSTAKMSLSVFTHWENVTFDLVNPTPSVSDALFAETVSLVRERHRMTTELRAGHSVVLEQKDDRKVERKQFARYTGNPNKNFVHIDAKSEMMQGDDMTNMEGTTGVTLGMSAPTSASPLDAKTQTILPLLKRFVPVANIKSTEISAEPLNLDITDMMRLDGLGVVTDPHIKANQFSYWAALFAGFRGAIRFYVNTNMDRVTILYNNGPKLSFIDFETLVGHGTATDVLTTSAPLLQINYAMSGQAFFTAPWLSPNRFVVLPKLKTNLGTRYQCGAVHIGSVDPGTTKNLSLYAAFADSAKFSLPVGIPRLRVRSSNVGSDSYPSPFPSAEVPEFLRLVNQVGGPALTWTAHAELFGQALDSAPTADPEVPPRIKQPAAWVIVRTAQFAVADLVSLGVVPGDTVEVSYTPGAIQDYKVDLTTNPVYCIPAVTRMIFSSSATDTWTQDANQDWIFEENTATVTSTFDYGVGVGALASYPWSAGFLSQIYSLDIATEVATPYPLRAYTTRLPLNTFVYNSETYGVVKSTDPRLAMLKN